MASEDEAWIWVATSQKVVAVEPQLTVERPIKRLPLSDVEVPRMRGRDEYVPLEEPHGLFWDAKQFRCVALGQRLFVTLVGMWPKAARFERGIVFGYDLRLTLEDASSKQTTKWLSDLTAGILYKDYGLPTFFVSSEPSVLAHASCRRPGAAGADAFIDLDARLEKTATDVSSRPSALFLTGDQIYADDVAFSLFRAIRALAVDLMGYDEYMPSTYDQKGTYAFELAAGDIAYTTPEAKEAAKKRPRFVWEDEGPLGTRRGNILKHGLTTDDGEGHLLTFGEFAAMYLLVWNPDLATLYGLEKDLKKTGWGGDANLKGFTKGIAAARRTLANVPTYMIFDDHEITDDWNINKQWITQTDNLFARRVIANGLAAYWAFQGWGTNPSGYGTAKHTIIDLVEKHLQKQQASSGKLYRFNDRDFGKPMLAWTDWSYVAPTSPQVVVADMRTHRRHTYRDRAHMDGEVANRFVNFLARLVDHRAPLFLVFASPLLGWQPVIAVRSAGLKLEGGALEKELGDLFEDIPEGRFALIRQIQQLAEPTMCVIFSGDVHFSHVEKGLASAAYRGRSAWTMPIVQVTSSPMKNENSRLNARRAGTTQANLMEEAFSTKASDLDPGSPDVLLEWQSVTLKGNLGHETIIPKNNCCFVSLLGPKRLAIEFVGEGKQASYDVSV